MRKKKKKTQTKDQSDCDLLIHEISILKSNNLLFLLQMRQSSNKTVSRWHHPIGLLSLISNIWAGKSRRKFQKTEPVPLGSKTVSGASDIWNLLIQSAEVIETAQ